MKKKQIIIISVVLLAVIGLSLFLFLPKKGKGGQELLQDDKGVYYLDEDNNKVYKIVMMDHGIAPTTNEYKYRQMVLDEINQRLLNDLGYKIDVEVNVYADDQFADKLGFALADGDQLDLVRQASKPLLTSYVSQGIAKDITAYVENADSLNENIPDEMWAETRYDGCTYAIPLDKLSLGGVVYMRGDHLDKVGLDTLDSIEDWETYMQAVLDGGSEYLDSRMDTVPLMGSFDLFETMFYGNYTNTPGNFFNDENQIRPKYFDPGYKQFILKLREWLSKGYIDSSMFNFNEFGMKEYMTNQITGAIAAGIYHLEFGSLLEANKAHPEWDIQPCMPLTSTEGKYASTGLMGEYLFVPYCAKSAGVAVELVDWALYNKENYMLLGNGILNTTYIIEEGNSINIPEAERKANITTPTHLIGRFSVGTSVEYNMTYPRAECPEGAKTAYEKCLAISNDKLYVDPTIYVNEKLTDMEVAQRASADGKMAVIVQNLLTLNRDGSFVISDEDFDSTWNNMLNNYEGVAIYNKLTTEYNNKFNK